MCKSFSHRLIVQSLSLLLRPACCCDQLAVATSLIVTTLAIKRRVEGKVVSLSAKAVTAKLKEVTCFKGLSKQPHPFSVPTVLTSVDTVSFVRLIVSFALSPKLDEVFLV